MKKATLIGLVMLLLLASVIPVLAKNNHSNGVGNGQTADVSTAEKSNQPVQSSGQGQLKEKSLNKEETFSPNTNSSRNQNNGNAELPFYIQGTITSIDTAAGTITVSLSHGNAQVKMYIGSELTMNISEGVQVFQVTQGDDDGDMKDYYDRDMDDNDDRDMDDDDDRDMDDDDDRDMDDDDDRDMDDDNDRDINDDDDRDMDDDDDREMDDDDRDMDDDDDRGMKDAYDRITVSDDDDMDSMKEVISIDQLAVGQKVSIHGVTANDLFTATTITVYIRLDGGERIDD